LLKEQRLLRQPFSFSISASRLRIYTFKGAAEVVAKKEIWPPEDGHIGI